VPGLDDFTGENLPPDENQCIEATRRLLLVFSKSGPAVYLGHLDVMSVFERSLQRAGISVDFTEGFNPKPRIEFAQPLSLGLRSEREICTIKMKYQNQKASDLATQINAALPSGLEIISASWIGEVPEGRKVVKVMSAFWGSDWTIDRNEELKSEIGEISSTTELADALDTECRIRGVIDDCSIETSEEGHLHVRLRHGGTRHHNIMRLLESVLGKPVLETSWRITRKECWASDLNRNPIPFETAFPETYESV
jgi:radical SAM-linked protein